MALDPALQYLQLKHANQTLGKHKFAPSHDGYHRHKPEGMAQHPVPRAGVGTTTSEPLLK